MELFGLSILEWSLPLLIGIVAGFVTNAVAIWMLFHPYEPVMLAGVRVFPMGAIPKEIARIARRIGEVVGNELLTPGDIAQTLSSSAFRQRFDEVLRGALQRTLNREIGALRELVPMTHAAGLDEALDRLLSKLLEGMEIYFASEDWERRVRRFARGLSGEFRGARFSVVLTPELQADVSRAARDLWSSVRESPEFARVIAEALDRAVGNLMVSEKPVRDYVPTGAVNLGESFVTHYLPILLDHLGRALDDPATRMRLQLTLRRLLDRFLEEQQTWKRIVGRLVITERTLSQTVDAIEQGGADEIAAMLREPAVQARVSAAVNDGLEELLDRPVRELLGDVSPERAARLRQALVERVLYLFRHPTTEDVVMRRLDVALASAGARTVGDLLDLLGEERSAEFTDRIADWVVEVSRGPRTLAFVRGVVEHQTSWMLSVPIGRPAAYLPPDAMRRLELLLFDPLWGFLQKRVPTAVAGLPVAEMVENKLRSYPVWKVEELIWRISKKELVLIIYLGGFLGALVGSLMLVLESPPAGLLVSGVILTASFLFVNLRS